MCLVPQPKTKTKTKTKRTFLFLKVYTICFAQGKWFLLQTKANIKLDIEQRSNDSVCNQSGKIAIDLLPIQMHDSNNIIHDDNNWSGHIAEELMGRVISLELFSRLNFHIYLIEQTCYICLNAILWKMMRTINFKKHLSKNGVCVGSTVGSFHEWMHSNDIA